MIKLSKINENVLTDIIDRSRTGSLRKEDMLHPKNYKELNDIIESEYEKQRKNLDLRHIDVSKIDNLSNIFFNMKDLETIDVTGWDTSSVTNMNYMFCDCKSLKEIKGIENWDVSNVKHMTNMFSNCESLKEINDIKNWDVSNVINMHCMFSNCKSLEHLDLSGWNMCSVIYMNFMFDGCESLEYLELGGWNICSMIYMDYMFCDCKSLKEIRGIENWNFRNANIKNMFSGCSVSYKLKDKTLIKENVLTDIIDRSRTGSLRKEDNININTLNRKEFVDYIIDKYEINAPEYIKPLISENYISIPVLKRNSALYYMYILYKNDEISVIRLFVKDIIWNEILPLPDSINKKFYIDNDGVEHSINSYYSNIIKNTDVIDFINHIIEKTDMCILKKRT